jgi:hypothetical protein
VRKEAPVKNNRNKRRDVLTIINNISDVTRRVGKVCSIRDCSNREGSIVGRGFGRIKMHRLATTLTNISNHISSRNNLLKNHAVKNDFRLECLRRIGR